MRRDEPVWDTPGSGAWFQRRPVLTAAVCLVLFATVTVLRFAAGDDAAIGITMLYLLPVSLIGLTWGRIAGVGAGLAALGLVTTWAVADDVDISALGWLSRAAPLVLTGYLLGDASNQLRRAENERLLDEASKMRHQQAVEVNDSLVQGMAAAKWALEAGRLDRGLELLTETLSRGQALVSELIREADAHEHERSSDRR